MEPEGPLLFLQKPASRTYPKPDESIPQAQILFVSHPFKYFPSIYGCSLFTSYV
jgi:hypothetical protein